MRQGPEAEPEMVLSVQKLRFFCGNKKIDIVVDSEISPIITLVSFIYLKKPGTFFFIAKKIKIKIIEFYFSKKIIVLNHVKSLDSAIFYDEISCLLHESRNRR